MRFVRALTAAPALAVVFSAMSTMAGAAADSDVSAALAVLHRWDAARSSAWVRADPAAVRRLYVTGSSAGVADVRLLRRYRARGIRVTWLGTQVFSVRVGGRTPTELRLVVVDRVVGAVTTPRRCMHLPVESPARRVVDLRRVDGGWRVSAVS